MQHFIGMVTTKKYNKAFKYVPALRASTGRLTAPLN